MVSRTVSQTANPAPSDDRPQTIAMKGAEMDDATETASPQEAKKSAFSLGRIIPLGLLGLAAVIPDPVASRQLMHLMGMGAMAGMILAMIARVSLGHTGRKLVADNIMAFAFVAIFGAAILRSVGVWLFPDFQS